MERDHVCERCACGLCLKKIVVCLIRTSLTHEAGTGLTVITGDHSNQDLQST